jgi:hypothetical protein
MRHQSMLFIVTDTLAGRFKIICIDVKFFARRFRRPQPALARLLGHGENFL